MQVMNKSQYQEFFSWGILGAGKTANRCCYGAHCAPLSELFPAEIIKKN
jgi:hypothetical protein